MSQYGIECISACFCMCCIRAVEHIKFSRWKKDSGIFLKFSGVFMTMKCANASLSQGLGKLMIIFSVILVLLYLTIKMQCRQWYTLVKGTNCLVVFNQFLWKLLVRHVNSFKVTKFPSQSKQRYLNRGFCCDSRRFLKAELKHRQSKSLLLSAVRRCTALHTNESQAVAMWKANAIIFLSGLCKTTLLS